MQRELRSKNFFLRHAICLTGLLLFSGCATRGNVDLLESRLRSQEAQVRSLQSDLQSAQVDLDIAQQDAGLLRKQLATNGNTPTVPEDASVLYRANNIKINKLLTGGLNEDEEQGDEVLNAVIVPIDAQGELVKVPGKIQIELFDMTLPKESQRIGQWNFDQKDSQNNWHHGFIISGYQFKLPWQTVPQNNQLLLHARLVTTDGRQFDVSEKVTITPPASSSGFMNEKPVPAPPAAEPEFLPQFPVGSAKPLTPRSNPFSKVSQEKEKKTLKTGVNNTPLGESPWRARKPNEQFNPPLETSDRRSNPIFEAQKGTVIR